MQWLFPDLLALPKLAERQGALHWLRAYDLAACRNGYTMITPTPDSARLIQWLIEEGIDEARAWREMDTTTAVDHIIINRTHKPLLSRAFSPRQRRAP